MKGLDTLRGAKPQKERAVAVTLQMIADRVGVSRATVSRALKNNPRISLLVREKVQAVAQELNYQNDAQLVALMKHLRHRKDNLDRPVIAFLVYQKRVLDISIEEAGQSVQVGAWERAIQCGYRPEVFDWHDLLKKGVSISRVLYARGIRGVIVCPFEVPGPMPEIDRNLFSMVAIGYSIHGEHLHRAVTNQYQGMLDCIAQLRSRGYTRVGAVLGGWSDLRTRGHYRAAYLLAKDESEGMECLPILTLRQEQVPSWGSDFMAWYRKYRPEAVILGAVSQLHSIMPVIERAGISVPGDLGIICTHLTPGDRYYSGILQNSYQVGQVATDMLITLMENNEASAEQPARIVHVEGGWSEGQTLRPVREQGLPPIGRAEAKSALQ